MKLLQAAIASLAAITAAAAPAPKLQAGPVHDSNRLLSRKASSDIRAAATAFKDLTGRWMIVMVLPQGPVADLPVLETLSGVPVGLVYATTPDDATGRLMIVDPVWRKALPAQWNFMVPQRLAQKYGAEAFERRVVLSAQYLAEVLPDKIAFVLKPRGGELSPGSLKFSRSAYLGIEILGYFIIFFTAFRTFWPARLKDEDQDDFSNELRRLKKERQIW